MKDSSGYSVSNTSEAIEATKTRLKNNVRNQACLEALCYLSAIVAPGLLLFGYQEGLSLSLVLVGILLVGIYFWRRLSRNISDFEIAQLLDKLLNLKERAISVTELEKTVGDSSILAGFVEKQLTNTWATYDPQKLFPFILPQSLKNPLYLLPLLWIMTIFSIVDHNSEPPKDLQPRKQALAIMLEQKENIENLSSQLKNKFSKLQSDLKDSSVSLKAITNSIENLQQEIENSLARDLKPKETLENESSSDSKSSESFSSSSSSEKSSSEKSKANSSSSAEGEGENPEKGGSGKGKGGSQSSQSAEEEQGDGGESGGDKGQSGTNTSSGGKAEAESKGQSGKDPKAGQNNSAKKEEPKKEAQSVAEALALALQALNGNQASSASNSGASSAGNSSSAGNKESNNQSAGENKSSNSSTSSTANQGGKDGKPGSSQGSSSSANASNNNEQEKSTSEKEKDESQENAGGGTGKESKLPQTETRGEAPEGGESGGLKGPKGYKDAQISEKNREDLDVKETSTAGVAEGERSTKSQLSIKDLERAKPKAIRENFTQPIPLEYKDEFR